MNPERWEQISQLLETALALDPIQRAVFLDQISSADVELRREVESLLASHDEAGSQFLNVTGASDETIAGPAFRPPLRTGRRIGPYTIVEEIGRGGMGEVFSAIRTDGQFEKKVAIKLVRSGYDSAHILNRFRNERQILAGLEHPNIARLLDGGTTDRNNARRVEIFNLCVSQNPSIGRPSTSSITRYGTSRQSVNSSSDRPALLTKIV